MAAGLADPVGERGVEHLHVDRADVVADPVLEDVDQEPPVAFGAHGSVGHQRAVERVQGAHPAAITPARVGERDGLGRRPLHDRDGLDEGGAALVAQKPVDLAAVASLAAWTVVRTL